MLGCPFIYSNNKNNELIIVLIIIAVVVVTTRTKNDNFKTTIIGLIVVVIVVVVVRGYAVAYEFKPQISNLQKPSNLATRTVAGPLTSPYCQRRHLLPLCTTDRLLPGRSITTDLFEVKHLQTYSRGTYIYTKCIQPEPTYMQHKFKLSQFRIN